VVSRIPLQIAVVALAACTRAAPPAAAPALAASSPRSEAHPAGKAASDRALEATRAKADGWRAVHRLIDLHVHVDPTAEHLGQAVAVMDAVGIGVAVNLSGGTVTHAPGAPSALELTKRMADEHFPGRFLEYMNLDYAGWDEPDFSRKAVAQVDEGYRLGAAGFKEFKRLGLFLRDKNGALLHIDDARLDPMWHRLGELGMPVSIHVADPKAFWAPYDASNERWKELEDHPRWWFGDPAKFPPREELLAALERVVGRHPETTFVCVHMANNAEDLGWVSAQLDAHPNMMADIAARVPEFGRHDPDEVRAFFVKYADRILFATDFQVYDRMTLGSGGRGPAPTQDDAVRFYRTHWRYFETSDRDFPNMTPIQGDWTISAVHLPADVLEKVYFGNAERLLARPLAALGHSAGGTRAPAQ
jgi:predicted TIM-barrel fold metal-dependent hydrolase